METVIDFIFLDSKITTDGDCSHEMKKCLPPGRKAMTNLDNILKNRHYFANKGPYTQTYSFSSSHVRLWELDQKEGWAPKIWYLRTVVLEKTLECPLDCKEIQPVHPKGNQSWIFTGRTDAEAEAPIFQPLNGNIQLIGKDPDVEKDWRQEEKGTTEDEMVGWNSLTQWPWVWANSGRWWRTEKPSVLQSLGLQKVRYDLATQQ